MTYKITLMQNAVAMNTWKRSLNDVEQKPGDQEEKKTSAKPNFMGNENPLSLNSLYCDLSVIRVHYTSAQRRSLCSEEESGSQTSDSDKERLGAQPKKGQKNKGFLQKKPM